MDPQVTPLEPLLTSSLSVEKWLMTTPYCTVLDRPLDRGGGEGLQKNYFLGLKRRGRGGPPGPSPGSATAAGGRNLLHCTQMSMIWSSNTKTKHVKKTRKFR